MATYTVASLREELREQKRIRLLYLAALYMIQDLMAGIVDEDLTVTEKQIRQIVKDALKYAD